MPKGTMAIDDRPDIANGLDELRPEIEREELDCSHYLRPCSHFGTEDVREKAMTKYGTGANDLNPIQKPDEKGSRKPIEFR